MTDYPTPIEPGERQPVNQGTQPSEPAGPAFDPGPVAWITGGRSQRPVYRRDLNIDMAVDKVIKISDSLHRRVRRDLPILTIIREDFPGVMAEPVSLLVRTAMAWEVGKHTTDHYAHLAMAERAESEEVARAAAYEAMWGRRP